MLKAGAKVQRFFQSAKFIRMFFSINAHEDAKPRALFDVWQRN